MWDQAERSFFWEALADNRTNFKEFFNICKNILGRNNELLPPLSDSNINLANNFNNYIHDKIGNIYSSLVQHNQATVETYRVEVHPPQHHHLSWSSNQYHAVIWSDTSWPVKQKVVS